MERRTDVQHHLQLLGLVCGALVAGVLVMAALGAWLVRSGALGPAEGELSGGLLWSLGAVSVAAFVAASALQRTLAGPGAGRDTLLERHRTATVVSFALRESVAVLGFVTGLVTGSVAVVVLLPAAAAVAMLLAWPRRAPLEARLRKAPDSGAG